MKSFQIEKIIASLENQLDQAEQKFFENWLEQSKENRQLYEETKKVFEASQKARINFHPDAEQALQKINRRLKTKQLARWSYRAAAVFVLLLLAAKILFFPAETQWHEITAENRQVIYLADHSKVILAQNATLKYPEEFEKKHRNVFLKGKAYFEITKNQERPFTVETNHTNIKVLGTRFLVDASANSTEKVFVEEGKVAFNSRSSANSQPLILTKNEAGTWLAENNRMTESSFSNLNQNTWLSGRLNFENATLETVLEDFEAHFNIKIECGESIKNKKYTGVFTEATQVEKALQIVATTLNLQINKTENTYIIKP